MPVMVTDWPATSPPGYAVEVVMVATPADQLAAVMLGLRATVPKAVAVPGLAGRATVNWVPLSTEATANVPLYPAVLRHQRRQHHVHLVVPFDQGGGQLLAGGHELPLHGAGLGLERLHVVMLQ
jgi:hypothetical protein